MIKGLPRPTCPDPPGRRWRAATRPPKCARRFPRGEYLTRAADCAACHNALNGKPFAGGVPFKLPFGTIYSTNITADRETGIGGWSDDDFVRALHRGIAPGGRYLYPAFPYTSFRAMSRDDALAIKAHLFTLPPQHATSAPAVRCAQIPAVRRLLGERVKSTLSGHCRRCKNHADRAKTLRHIERCPIFAAYDRAEQKKSQKFALRTTVRSFGSSFRTVCTNYDDGVDGAPTASSAPKWSLSSTHLKGSRSPHHRNSRGETRMLGGRAHGPRWISLDRRLHQATRTPTLPPAPNRPLPPSTSAWTNEVTPLP